METTIDDGEVVRNPSNRDIAELAAFVVQSAVASSNPAIFCNEYFSMKNKKLSVKIFPPSSDDPK